MNSLPSIPLKFAGIGSALPDKVVTNADLSTMIDTSDEWITERTGIKERRVGGTTSGLAIEASQLAIERSGIDPQTIEQVVLATTTPDKRMPGSSATIARELGLTCGTFDLQAACAGWVYGLVVANGFLAQGTQRLLLVGSETMDRMVDPADRSTAILFGNGAGAVILDSNPSAKGELLSWDLGTDGSLLHLLYTDYDNPLRMDGREVFRKAVTVVVDSSKKTMEKAGVTAADIKLIVPHQANIRILESAWKRLGFSIDDTAVVLDRTGNTSAASIPIALNDAVQRGSVDDGDLVLFVGFGSGMTWGSALVRWAGQRAHAT